MVENKGNQMIFLDYGHSPDAYLKVLKTLKDNFNYPLKVLFGAGGVEINLKTKNGGSG